MLTERPQAYTVSAITRRIKANLEESFRSLWVEGEISGYLHHTSGHRYMSLKDDKAVLKVVMWRSVGASLKFEPKNGQSVLVQGDITVYERGGQYQLTARKIVPVGIGELELAFRQLHEKLSQEGLFDDDRKQPIPDYAQTVGIVTSPTGAAIRDIIQIARRRNPSVKLIIYPAQVQGPGSEQTIAAGIDYFNTRNDIDVIITGRGGGSLEDLWCFNEELVVRAIDQSRIPVVSAVGHEIDVTLSDMVADLRAPTPSAAAELVIWSRRELSDRINGEVANQAYYLEQMVLDARERLQNLLSRPVYARPEDALYQRRQYLDQLTRMLISGGKNSLERFRNRLSLRLSQLEAFSPLKTLARGYSVTRDIAGQQLIRSVEDLTEGQNIETILPDGTVNSVVETVKRNRL